MMNEYRCQLLVVKTCAILLHVGIYDSKYWYTQYIFATPFSGIVTRGLEPLSLITLPFSLLGWSYLWDSCKARVAWGPSSLNLIHVIHVTAVSGCTLQDKTLSNSPGEEGSVYIFSGHVRWKWKHGIKQGPHRLGRTSVCIAMQFIGF